MRRVAPWALAACALLACRRPPAATGLSLTAVGSPTVGRPTAFSVAGAPAALDASFTADMTHPGMTPLVAKASETAPGRYEASLTWTMAGDWVVFFEARGPGGRTTTARRAVRVEP